MEERPWALPWGDEGRQYCSVHLKSLGILEGDQPEDPWELPALGRGLWQPGHQGCAPKVLGLYPLAAGGAPGGRYSDGLMRGELGPPGWTGDLLCAQVEALDWWGGAGHLFQRGLEEPLRTC